LYDRNCGRARVVLNVVLSSPSPDLVAALRRLLVGLERPAHLDEWRHRERPRELPKAA
jgi:hypothetical protein